MPAETIHGDGMPIDVKISWGAGGEAIQVAALHEHGAKTIIDIVNAWLTAANMKPIDFNELSAAVSGGMIIQRPEIHVAGPRIQFDGWHATFDDRAKINRMIAVLRRARDHAFGKDE